MEVKNDGKLVAELKGKFEEIRIVTKRETKLYSLIKRTNDILFSLIGLMLLFPFFLILVLIIKLESPGKAIFTQKRTGKNGKTFNIYKFRSMRRNAELERNKLLEKNEMDGPVFKIAQDPRITKVGKFIRKTSIDELPQLFNILKGDMSIVGPRPLVVYETEKFTNYENKRHEVRPGLTCFWQISGRNNISFEQWIELDLKYINEMSYKVDIHIFIKTIKVVLLRTGAY